MHLDLTSECKHSALFQMFVFLVFFFFFFFKVMKYGVLTEGFRKFSEAEWKFFFLWFRDSPGKCHCKNEMTWTKLAGI